MRSFTILLLLSFSVTQSVSAMGYLSRLFFGFQAEERSDQQWQVVAATEEAANNPQATYAQIAANGHQATYPQIAANGHQATEGQQVAASSVRTVMKKRKTAKKDSQSCECSLPDHEEPREFPKENYSGPKAFKKTRKNLALAKRSCFTTHK
jgi:hypothetical protein